METRWPFATLWPSKYVSAGPGPMSAVLSLGAFLCRTLAEEADEAGGEGRGDGRGSSSGSGTLAAAVARAEAVEEAAGEAEPLGADATALALVP